MCALIVNYYYYRKSIPFLPPSSYHCRWFDSRRKEGRKSVSYIAFNVMHIERTTYAISIQGGRQLLQLINIKTGLMSSDILKNDISRGRTA